MTEQNLSHAATELMLYAENDAGCMRAFIEPTWRNLERKHRKGVFSYDLGLKQLCRHTLVNCAKQYHLEHGSMSQKWSSMFPMSVRFEVAEVMLERFLAELRLGNSWL